MRRVPLAPTLVLLAVCATARAGDVILVDPGGGDGVGLLQAAILSATHGDTLLLADGNYLGGVETLYVIKEGLRILPAPGAGRPALRRLDIQDLPAGQTLVLRGLDIGGPVSPGPFAPLHVFDNDGAVWVEDCTFRGNDAVPSPGFVPAGGQGSAFVGGTGEACFRNCTFQGGRGADAQPDMGIPFSGGGGDGLVVDNLAEVALFECVLAGGDGGNGPATTIFGSGRGGDALAVGYDATVAGCTLTGGAEGAGNDAQPSSSGAAISTFLAAADVRVLSSTLVAGAVQGAGTATPAIDDPANKVLLLDEPSRSVALPDQLREGESGVLALDGEPGDVAWIVLSADATLIPLLGQKGTLTLDLASLLGPIVLGVLPGPDGVLAVPFTLPALPPGTEAATVFVQGVFLDADGSALGGASALTWIDSTL